MMGTWRGRAAKFRDMWGQGAGGQGEEGSGRGMYRRGAVVEPPWNELLDQVYEYYKNVGKLYEVLETNQEIGENDANSGLNCSCPNFPLPPAPTAGPAPPCPSPPPVCPARPPITLSTSLSLALPLLISRPQYQKVGGCAPCPPSSRPPPLPHLVPMLAVYPSPLPAPPPLPHLVPMLAVYPSRIPLNNLIFLF